VFYSFKAKPTNAPKAAIFTAICGKSCNWHKNLWLYGYKTHIFNPKEIKLALAAKNSVF
jgi:hypothetical protein